MEYPKVLCWGPSSPLFTRHTLRQSRNNMALVPSSTPTTLSSIWPLTSPMLLTPSHTSRLVCSASGGGWLTTSSNLMTKRRLCCSWEHLLWDHNLTSVVSPSATLSLAAQPLHAILVLSPTSTLAWRPMSEMSAALHFTIFTTSAGSAMSLISKQPRQSSRPSLFPVWTIVTHFCMGCHLHSSTGCSGVQNAAARVVAQAGGREHITPVLFRLHWLPVQYHITFKILLLTYRALHGLAPSYLTALLTPYQPSRALRSGQQHLLRVPQTTLLTFGDRSFAIAAPKLWNSLPCKIREAASLGAFKKALKTHLFGLAYSHLLGISDN